ncbi:MliC family protein [Aliifodinibius sp. S!AR15-10]|uniref:MliC family protein n=1 Tax=Aliifodinibius sp. S!AR15-10 TaxID=2950437 RepID=UPI002854A956|nr:MliC family protein [Aliifodinibius sp. S!AR15-10]MDR8390348.1 MliC family protein [Aliifodinibius sp. S!AR15-10]
MQHHRFLSLIALAVSLVMLVSCSQEQEKEPSPTPHPKPEPTGKTYVYNCLEAANIIVKVDTADAWLFLQDTTVHLPQAKSASGARFMTEDYLYWSKGDEALVEIDNQSYGYCDVDQKETVWADALLRGASFRAAGNEPGWYLEVYPDSIKYVLDYGERTLVTPSPEQEFNTETTEKIYKVETEEHNVTIRATDESCTSMAGKEFESTVYLAVDGKEYQGCGKELRYEMRY